MIQFKTPKSLRQHFKKHGPSVGALTKEEYLSLANRVLRRPIHVAPAKDQAIRYVAKTPEEHVILDPISNKILTYYVRKALLR